MGTWSKPPPGLLELEEGAAVRYKRSHGGSLVRNDGEEVRCCVLGCDKWLPVRHRGVKSAREFCPDHGLSVSLSPTYVLRHREANFIVARDMVAPMTKAKVETWRLGNERSEDALSWNVFVSLERLGLLPEAIPELSGFTNVELYLWGTPFNDPDSGLWDRIQAVRRELEPGLRLTTEPDIILRVPGKILILIEAKFGSGNSTLKGKEERFGDSADEFLERYRAPEERPDPLNRLWLRDQPLEGVLEQLCRNALFASHLAERGEQAVVINLVRQGAEGDVESRFAKHLNERSSVAFRRMAWEDLWPVLATAGTEAGHLRDYLAKKTLGLQRAFPSLPA